MKLICKSCKRSLSNNLFYKHKTNKSGRTSSCKKCVYAEQKQLYPKPVGENRTNTQWFNNTKARAKKKNVPFNLTIEDLVIPNKCPILDIPLVRGSGSPKANSPSIDRIKPELGYVKGNIQIISFAANWIKRDYSPDVFRRLVTYMEQSIEPK